jgi:hypothetical protein
VAYPQFTSVPARRAALCALLCAGLLACAAAPVNAAQRKPAADKPAEKPRPKGDSLCPAAVNVEQRVSAVPEGWETAVASQPHRLAAVTLYDGPPAERASLKFGRDEKQKREWIATWELQPNERGYWIECGYDRTTAVLTRRLAPSVAECTMTYERKRGASGGPVIKHVGCK